jgi:hypothetical protein
LAPACRQAGSKLYIRLRIWCLEFLFKGTYCFSVKS